MPTARADYQSRMHSLENALTVDTIKSKSLTDIIHNDIARLLRNGLAVVAFAALEDFIKQRTSEVLSQIGASPVKFSELPVALRYAATYKAISALNFQISWREKEDKVAYIQEQAMKIASTASTPYEITPHAFGYNQANITEDTISEILKALFVNDPWAQISALSARLNITALPLRDAFINAARRRHKAAHVASASIPERDLQDFVNESYGIAAAFDVLISEGLKKIQLRSIDHLKGQKVLKSADIKLRFLRNSQGKWKELSEGKSRAYRTAPDLNLLESQAILRANSNNEYLFVFDEKGKLKEWFT